jgi:hypothetical protein
MRSRTRQVITLGSTFISGKKITVKVKANSERRCESALIEPQSFSARDAIRLGAARASDSMNICISIIPERLLIYVTKI